MHDSNVPAFTFIVDTGSYAGNFERELCAYVTGMLGECEVGSDQAEEFASQLSANPFEEIIEQIMDDSGCSRPVSIWKTPGWFNNGAGKHYREDNPDVESSSARYPAYQSVAIFFSKELSGEMQVLLKERAAEYCARQDITITGFRLLKSEVHTEEVSLS